MEKTYKLLDNTEPMTMAEIRRLYTGYWVFIIKAKFTDTGGLIDGIPVIIGAVPYDGVEDGIYDKYGFKIAPSPYIQIRENTLYIYLATF